MAVKYWEDVKQGQVYKAVVQEQREQLDNIASHEQEFHDVLTVEPGEMLPELKLIPGEVVALASCHWDKVGYTTLALAAHIPSVVNTFDPQDGHKLVPGVVEQPVKYI